MGTVQFGQAYGLANATGRIDQDEAADILEFAWGKGVDTLDTAVAYGDSEKTLGEIGVGKWRVISKLPASPQSCEDIAGWVEESTTKSLERLGVDRFGALLMHNPQELLGPRAAELYDALVRLKDQGLVEKVGVSVYGPEEVEALWPHFQFDLVQAPLNVFDRRMATSGWLHRLHESGTEVHVRSLFLQGLLLMTPTSRPAFFDRWLTLWRAWDGWLDRQALTPLHACLGLAMSYEEVDRFVIGVDSLTQLREIVDYDAAPAVTPPRELRCEDLDLINPSRWKLS